MNSKTQTEMNLTIQAESLRKDLRRQIIMDYKETDLHKELKELFQTMQPDYTVEITHGSREFGKDLVIVKSDAFGYEVFGIVVKCGNIRGKTLDDVDSLKAQIDRVFSNAEEKRLDEIKSQIEQALAHPAEMKSYLEDLPVNMVYVVLAGEFSNNARKRLINELPDKIEIYDINWLIDKFTVYYPSVFFHGRVIDFLEKKIIELEEKHHRAKSGKNLSEYFVNPLIQPLGAAMEFDEEKLETVIKTRRSPFSELLDITRRHKKLILAGDPGTGKTGAMAKLTIDSYQNAYKYLLKTPGKADGKVTIPLFIHAREFLKSESVESLLTKYFGLDENINRFNVDLLIVDGLDEIEPCNRSEVIDKLDVFSEEMNNSYILTTRKIDLVNTLPEKYAKFELLPFEFNQALRLVNKLVNDRKVLEAMKESLEKIQAQVLLAPLSLMLLIELVEDVKEREEIPASITELYDRFFDMVLGREDREKGIEILFEYHIKKKFLGELAYEEFWKKNRFEITNEDFKTFLDEYANRYQLMPGRLDDFVKELERTGILNLRDEIIFKHRLFLDYFAAYHVHEIRADIDDLNSLVVSTYFDDTWSEVAFFYIGLRREISQDLLERIYSYSEESPTVDLFKLLGGRLLQAGWHSTTEQYTYCLKEAISYVPRVRQHFQELIDSSDSYIPGIVSDFVTFNLTNLSFNSSFLLTPVKDVLEKLVNSGSTDDVYPAVALLWSVRRFLNAAEVKEKIDKILEKLDEINDDTEQARTLLLLTLIEGDNETRVRIERQTKRLAMKSKKVFTTLLPARRKGFR